MLLKNNYELKANPVLIDGAKDVVMRMLIGPEDPSENIAMRLFTVAPNGHTPRHQHNYEHLVKVEKNKGIYVDQAGNNHEIKEGMSIFVPANEVHQFQNPYDEPFEFICIIPVNK